MPISRRTFVAGSVCAAVLRGATLTPRERVDRALAGKDADRPPATFWYHFLDQDASGSDHARKTVEFHRKFHTDIVKVMSDYPFPKPAGQWYEVRRVDNPFPRQIEALREIKERLGGEAYFLETLFNPYNVAEKLSSKETVERMKRDDKDRLLAALDGIARSEMAHAKRAIEAGASGIFLAIANSADPDYGEFSEEFDEMVLDAAAGARLNVLHIHGDKIDLAPFYDSNAAVINYSIHGTKIPFSDTRQRWKGVLMGGVDENEFRKLGAAEIRKEVDEARRQAGPKYFASGGCSVPNDTSDAELSAAMRALGA
jgi:uroporphyrinogen decarboxylase